MKPSFCAIANQQAGEDLIGTANHYQTYVLIECPTPWAAKVFTAESLPPTLRQYVKAIKSERSVQFLAINRGAVQLDTAQPDAAQPTISQENTSQADTSDTIPSADSLTLMVYERTVPSEGIALSENAESKATGNNATANEAIANEATAYETVEDYRGYEFQLKALTDVVDCLKAHWQGELIGQPITGKNILICTHGMRDKCCARFGQPFFRDAVRSASRGELPNTQVWKVSHIGGHRFAPTAISFPDGRYYGRLTLAALQTIINRNGPISTLCSVYRGWGLLPAPLQVLEQQLMLTHGWSWFDQKVTYRILTDTKIEPEEKSETNSKDNTSVRTLPRHELSVEVSIEPKTHSRQLESSNKNTENNKTSTYRAKLTQLPPETMCVKISCSSTVAVPIAKYTITECVESKSLQSKPVSVL